MDILEIPHPDERRSYADLREEFRSTALARIRIQYAGHHPLGWQMIGDSATARDRFTSPAWCREMLLRLDAPVMQDFGLDSVPPSWSARLEKQASAAAAHDSVTWESDGEDQDAPPCGDVSAMTDDELCDYVDRSIRNGQ